MKNLSYCLIGFMLITNAYAQDRRSLDDVNEKRPGLFSTSGFSYPMFSDGETHSEFAVVYPINEKFETELQAFYDTYMLANVTRFNFRAKYYVTKKFYSFAGMAAEFEQSKMNGVLSPPRLFILSGVGYDVNDKLNLELNHEALINGVNPGLYGIPNSFSARGKFRF